MIGPRPDGHGPIEAWQAIGGNAVRPGSDIAGLDGSGDGAQFHMRTLRGSLPGNKAGQRREKRGQEDHQLQAQTTFAGETGTT